MSRIVFPHWLCILGLAALWSLLPLAAQAPPMNLETLKKVLAVGEDVVPTAEVLSRVKQEGVDFFLDADMKTELILSAAEGGRSEANTLSIINSLTDACVPCKERMEGPITVELALKFLTEQVRSRDILKEIAKRGLADGEITAAQIAELRKAGASDAMVLVMKPRAEPIVPSDYKPVPVTKARDFDLNRPYGSVDIRVRIDEKVEFRLSGSDVAYKLEAGKEPVAQGSTISGALPRLPADAISFTFRQKSGRAKAEQAAMQPADAFGFPAITFAVNDDKPREAAYQFEILWQVKPYTLDALKTDVEELSGSYPDMLAEMIRRRGYGSQLSTVDEQTLRTAGASAALISTIRGSIRPANAPPR
ncbi:MAG: hypothetical protein KIT83_03250 [Bryobacterales bacterium]|nr:hypothetical protein [Bryobacterales bacterium]